MSNFWNRVRVWLDDLSDQVSDFFTSPDGPEDPDERWHLWQDDLALEVARKIVSIDVPLLPGGEPQRLAKIQTIIHDALGKAQSPPLELRQLILDGIRWPDLIPNKENPAPGLLALAEQYVQRNDALDWDLAAGRETEEALDRRAMARVALTLGILRHKRGATVMPFVQKPRPVAYIGRAMIGYLDRSVDGYVAATLYSKARTYMVEDPMPVFAEAQVEAVNLQAGERYATPTLVKHDVNPGLALAAKFHEDKAEKMDRLAEDPKNASIVDHYRQLAYTHRQSAVLMKGMMNYAAPEPPAPDFHAHA